MATKDKQIKREALTKGMRVRVGGMLREVREVGFDTETGNYTAYFVGGSERVYREGDYLAISGIVPASVRCALMEKFGNAGKHLYSYSPSGRDRDARHVFEHPYKEKAFGPAWFSHDFLRRRTDFFMTGVLR